MGELIGLDGKELKRVKVEFNQNHFPSLEIEDVQLEKGILLVWRPGTPPEKKEASGIIRPDGERVGYRFTPCCSVVVKVGEGCKSKVGEYVFWQYAPETIRTTGPQPMVGHFQDNEPVYYFLREEHILARTTGIDQKHGCGGLTLGENND